MKKIITRAAASIMTAAVLTAGGVSAMAAEGNYSYQSGRQQYESRHQIFTEAAQQIGDSAREAFLAANGIGGDGPNSGNTRLDAEKLAEAGVIDQETAEKIAQYASEKQADRHAGYAGKSSMTAEERHSFYDGMKSQDGDPVEELLAAGVITQEQADAIQAYLN